MARNLIICLDGTRNEPETGPTNVARIYEIAVQDDEQVVYYDPGVGTMGARSATTRAAKTLTRVGGLLLGHGVQENISEAYQFLMHNYQPGDRIFVFGFSRGAYTARALVGMLRTIGLLRPNADNLIPYALKLYAANGKNDPSPDETKAFWKTRSYFTARFGNPKFPSAFNTIEKQIHFLGVWDTVKTIGWFNWRAQFEQARWPFTRVLTNVRVGRHAIAIDEKRRPYPEYRFDRLEVAKGDGRLREMWFAGVHSDVGGTFPDDHQLSDFALQWIADEARADGLKIRTRMYKTDISVAPGNTLPLAHSMGKIHTNGIGWAVVGLGWHHRVIEPGDEIHPSVWQRIAGLTETAHPYHPALPIGAEPPVGITP